jgi:hypothetical protein
MSLARLPFLLAMLALAVVLAGCGNKEDATTEAHTEGIYIDLGPFTYQVQISRELNFADPEDRAYLVGLPAGQRELAPDETWFAIFMRVENEEERTATPLQAGDFRIVDTLEQTYRPVPLDDSNNFAYEPRPLAHKDVIPHPDSIAAQGPIQGSLVLFKVKRSSLDNRPVELIIGSGTEVGIVDLDI